jgi:hypothetical protein
MKRLLLVVVIFLLFVVGVFAQVILTPTDALAFDYDNAVYQQYSVTGFQVQYDGAGAFQALQVTAFTDTGTLAGHTSYAFVPPFTNGNHTVSLKACNVFGCSLGSAPFAFGYAVSSAPTAVPTNLRRVPR